MNNKPYYQIPDWNLDSQLRSKILDLNWSVLPSTTASNRYLMAKLILQGHFKKQYSLWAFVKYYGIALQKICHLANIKLPTELEQQIKDYISELFPVKEIPVIRLQIMFGGTYLPIHIDSTRNASLVIPIAHCENTKTQFFSYTGEKMQLIDPSRCVLLTQTEITMPTMIDTTLPHSVYCENPVTSSHPRLSLTAKWPQTKYSELIDVYEISQRIQTPSA